MDLIRVELIPSELMLWALAIRRTDLWKSVSKGQDTMGWAGKQSLLELMTSPDVGESSQPDIRGKGKAD